MSTEVSPAGHEKKNVEVKVQGGSAETVYGLGVIGAWVFYMKGVKTFQEGATGFFKGIVWPAILVYRALQLLEKRDQ